MADVVYHRFHEYTAQLTYPKDLLLQKRRIGGLHSGILGLTCAAILTSCSKTETPLERLSSAIQEETQRPTMARLVGLPYRPMSAGPSPRGLKLLAVAGELATQRAGDERVIAAALLITGDSDTGISRLNEAVTRRRGDAPTWSDLSAALYENAVAHDNPVMFAKALAAADRAISLDGRLPEALFNRALALEHLGLLQDAGSAYKNYLKIDGTSPWSDEARKRLDVVKVDDTVAEWKRTIPVLEALVAKADQGAIDILVRRFPQQARTWSEGEFLARWAEEFQKGNLQESKHALDISRAVGIALRKWHGEALLADAVATIDRANIRDTTILAAAHVEYRTGRMLYARRSIEPALRLLSGSAMKFEAASSPMQKVASYFEANAAFDRHDSVHSRKLLLYLRKTVDPQYRALRAQIEWLESTIRGASGEPYEAFVACRNSLLEFEALGEEENATRMRASCITLLTLLGHDSEAWRLRPAMFRGSSRAGNPSLTEVVLNSAARDEISRGRWDTALALLRLQLARPAISDRLRFDAVMWAAFVESRITGAAPSFATALTASEQIKDPSLREDARDELRYAESSSHAGRPASDRVQLLTRVIEYRTRNDRSTLLPSAYIQRARAYRELGQSADAVADLDRAILAIESSGNAITQTDLYDTFFGVHHDAYEELTDVLVAQGKLHQALDVADRGRARALARNAPRSPWSLKHLRDQLPARTTAVHYMSLPSGLLIGIADRDGIRVILRPTPRIEVATLASQFVNAIRMDQVAETRRLGRLLGSILLKDLENRLVPGETLVIIPDETIAEVPFAALLSKNGHWLVENVRLKIAPSGAALGQRDRRPLTGAERTLVVADPAFDHTLFPKLDRLPAARREATIVKRLFPNAVVFSDAAATRDAVLQEIVRSEIVHIASHAISNRTDSARSVIVLAGSRGSDTLLYSKDIHNLSLPLTRLVFLAGCQTAASGGGDGSLRSVALSFLAAGSDEVVAAAWDVEDDFANSLSDLFYRELGNGQTTMNALRNAQLTMIGRQLLPRHWSAFQLFATRG